MKRSNKNTNSQQLTIGGQETSNAIKAVVIMACALAVAFAYFAYYFAAGSNSQEVEPPKIVQPED